MRRNIFFILLIGLFWVASCSQGGSGSGGGATGGGDTAGETPQNDGQSDAGTSGAVNVQKVLIPLDVLQIPCAEISGSPDENELILNVAENCSDGTSSSDLSFSLISKAYAAEDLPPEEPKMASPKRIYRIKCLQRCRIKENQIEFDVPLESADWLEKQLLLIQGLKEWSAILSVTLNDPTKNAVETLVIPADAVLFQMKDAGRNDFIETKGKERFKKKLQENILLDTKKEKVEEKNQEDKNQEEEEGELNKEEGHEEGEKKEKEEKEEPLPKELKDKKGLKELGEINLKTTPPSHHLHLWIGQQWETGETGGFIKRVHKCSAAEVPQYQIVSIQYFNPHQHRTDLEPSITLRGLKEGEAKVVCENEVKNFGKAQMIVFVTVEDPNKPKVEPPWEWTLPLWKENTIYFGELPMCTMADGTDSYVTQAGSLQEIAEGIYQMVMGEESSSMRNMEGAYRFRNLATTNKNVAVISHQNVKGFIIRSKKEGSALISWEAIRVKDKDQVVPEEVWKKIEVLVTVLPFFPTEQERLCPGEVKIEESKVDVCPANEAAPPTPVVTDHTVDPPATLTADEQALANRLYGLFSPANTPKSCTDVMIRRQSNKLAHCFYDVPTPDYLLASCVTCANKVGDALADCLKDEKIACFKINNIGRGNVPILDVPTHAATAVFPACSQINDDSLVLDTWFAPGNWIPSLHQHRVFKLTDWKSGKITDFGLNKEQTNLPK